MLKCGKCGNVFEENKEPVKKGYYANYCPECGIADYEKGANFTEVKDDK